MLIIFIFFLSNNAGDTMYNCKFIKEVYYIYKKKGEAAFNQLVLLITFRQIKKLKERGAEST